MSNYSYQDHNRNLKRDIEYYKAEIKVLEKDLKLLPKLIKEAKKQLKKSINNYMKHKI